MSISMAAMTKRENQEFLPSATQANCERKLGHYHRITTTEIFPNKYSLANTVKFS